MVTHANTSDPALEKADSCRLGVPEASRDRPLHDTGPLPVALGVDRPQSGGESVAVRPIGASRTHPLVCSIADAATNLTRALPVRYIG